MALGPGRSCQALADDLGVSKRSVTKRPSKDGWLGRLERIEAAAREKTDARMVDAFADMRERHIKTVRLMLARATKGLSQFPLTSGMEAIRAAEVAIKLERLVAGEASERTEVNVEEATRDEVRRLLVVAKDRVEDAGHDGDPPIPGSHDGSACADAHG